MFRLDVTVTAATISRYSRDIAISSRKLPRYRDIEIPHDYSPNKFVRKFGYAELIKPLMDDLKTLENDGRSRIFV